jgi:prepilin-type processing-associated H-X9-DG protein
LLAAILFPVFGRARENARRSSCQSNLKQLALGMSQYVQDYDETHPAPYSMPAGSVAGVPAGYSPAYGWANLIFPYVKSLQIYQCPSELFPVNPGLTQPEWMVVPGYTDYRVNRNFSTTYTPAYSNGTATDRGIRDSVLSAPAVTILLMDAENANQQGSLISPANFQSTAWNYANNGSLTAPFPTTGSGPMGMERHLEGANYAYADGHVKWLKHTSISRGPAAQYAAGGPYCEPFPASSSFCNAQPPSLLSGYAATFATFD